MASSEYDQIIEDIQSGKHAQAESIPSSTSIDLQKVVFACDAGMGSSAMGAATLSKKLKASGLNVTVPHYALNEVPLDTQVIVTHQSLVERAKGRCPQAKIYPVMNFMGANEYDQIVHDLCGA